MQLLKIEVLYYQHFIKNNFEKESETEYSYIEARKFVYKYINLLESIDSYSLQKIAKTFFFKVFIYLFFYI